MCQWMPGHQYLSTFKLNSIEFGGGGSWEEILYEYFNINPYSYQKSYFHIYSLGNTFQITFIAVFRTTILYFRLSNIHMLEDLFWDFINCIAVLPKSYDIS